MLKPKIHNYTGSKLHEGEKQEQRTELGEGANATQRKILASGKVVGISQNYQWLTRKSKFKKDRYGHEEDQAKEMNTKEWVQHTFSTTPAKVTQREEEKHEKTCMSTSSSNEEEAELKKRKKSENIQEEYKGTLIVVEEANPLQVDNQMTISNGGKDNIDTEDLEETVNRMTIEGNLSLTQIETIKEIHGKQKRNGTGERQFQTTTRQTRRSVLFNGGGPNVRQGMQAYFKAIPSIIIWELWRRRNARKHEELRTTWKRSIHNITGSILRLLKVRKPKRKFPNTWLEIVRELLEGKEVEFQHIMREGNKVANYIANLALDKGNAIFTNKNEMSLPSERRRFHLTEALKKILKERKSNQLENTTGTKKKEGDLEKCLKKR
ncbi:hypothetical protein R3W88_019476 [Solanum pinnatisectum]|uniref:RNase H type-1 domain-containing protein n=1 Tax=Solanum pinnatisectum TaxID=50273 RepID=A0AAV9KLY1_9SOLN|nr:hypothetical protein R3W88_019476 [Solanum pinnatisectum]